MSDLPDVVIPVRTGDHNPELRYALRSLANLPHGRVWLAGHMPRWVRDCWCIPTTQNRAKGTNIAANIIAACERADVAETFVLWNDDMILLEPIDAVPVWHRGSLRAFIGAHGHMATSGYMRGVATTCEILEALGYADPLCYELHVPLPMTKAGVLAAYRAATAEGMPPTRALQLRSLYGNHATIGGELATDVKIRPIVAGAPPWAPGPVPFVSTNDRLWAQRHPAVVAVAALYPTPGPYEAALPATAAR